MRTRLKDLFVMATFAQSAPAHSVTTDDVGASLATGLKSLCQRVAAFATTCADKYAAAALYDQLRGLSDAELGNRGLSRDTLARDVYGACDRTDCR
jgi:hypothetical protein